MKKLIYVALVILLPALSGYFCYRRAYRDGYADRDAKSNIDRQTLTEAMKKLPNGRLVLLNTRYHQWMTKHGYDPEKEGIYK